MANEIHGKSGSIFTGGAGALFNFTSTGGGALPAFGAISVANGGGGYPANSNTLVLNIPGGTGTVTCTVSAAGVITAVTAASAGSGYAISTVYTNWPGLNSGVGATAAGGGTVISGIKDWSIKYNLQAAEITNFQDLGVKRYIAGQSGWSGSFTGIKTGVPLNIVALGLVGGVFQEGTAAGQLWLGNLIITDLSPKVSVAGVVEYSYSFTGSGPLMLPTT